MTIFANKAAFMQLGLEQVNPSAGLIFQDCYICKDPLDVHIHTGAYDTHHPAVRIFTCGHLHGKECLSAWLDTSNSCPTCKRTLFTASGRPPSQSDITSIVRTLGRVAGKARVLSALTRLTSRQELERARLLHTHKEETREMQAMEVGSHHDALMEDGDWYPSSGEEYLATDDDLDMDEGNEDEDDEGAASGEEKTDPDSATT